ncbi:hypothetical protein ABTZ58_38795 [Streptomyces sp. NPDC094143]|uniref:hypothetical protein n=1 Tax=Streptomyces sp. NPDC094143 TaxID=3155310 RepID=UPI003333718F
MRLAARGTDDLGRADQDRSAAFDLAGPRWDRLTDTDGKADVFARDLFALEGWASLAGQLGEQQAYAFAERTSLMWLRPDAFAAATARGVLAAAEAAGFRPLAAQPVRLERCGIRVLWAYMCRWATTERLMLLDALAALGPGLLVVWTAGTGSARAAGGEPVSVRMTRLKGRNDARRREQASLRAVAGSPNRALTMLHTPDDPADVVRELAVFCDRAERAELIRQASTHLAGAQPAAIEGAVRAVEAELPPLGLPSRHRPGRPVQARELFAGPVEARWAALVAASHAWPLLTRTPQAAFWPEQEMRSPWT